MHFASSFRFLAAVVRRHQPKQALVPTGSDKTKPSRNRKLKQVKLHKEPMPQQSGIASSVTGVQGTAGQGMYTAQSKNHRAQKRVTE
jgi:hypothetical protein